LYESEQNAIYLVAIAFINVVTTRIRVFGDDRIPAKERRSSDIREPRLYRSIPLFYITFYNARVTVAVWNQKKCLGETRSASLHTQLSSCLIKGKKFMYKSAEYQLFCQVTERQEDKNRNMVIFNVCGS
jgi:hypothetical protein